MPSSFYGEGLHLNFLRGCLNDGACPLWDSCWARNMARRLAGRAGYPKDDPFKPHCPPRLPDVMMPALHRLRDARRPKVVAFNYMGDVACHEAKNVRAMAGFCDLTECQRHTFLWLTKRPALLREKLRDVRLPPNVWLGISALNQPMFDALYPDLWEIRAAHYWVSLEPLWGPILFPNSGPTLGRVPSWVVVGCESGPKRRLFRVTDGEPTAVRNLTVEGLERCEGEFLSAVRSLRDQCQAAGTPLFVKQLPIGGIVEKDVAKFPADLRIRDRPWRLVVEKAREA